MEETTPVAAGSNKKMLYIGLGVLALIILGAIFMGAGRRSSPGSAYLPGPAGVDTDRNMDGSVTYSNTEGSVTVGGGSMPENWPSDAPVAYAGAQIMYSGTTNPQTGEAGSAVVYQTNASVQSVTEYYSSRLKAEGWTIEASADMAGMRVITAKKDTRTFGAYIADGGNGMTSVTAGIEL